CVVAGGNPQRVSVERDEVHVELEIHCTHPAGTIQVTTVTSGPRPDPDGYDVTVGGMTQHIESSGALTVSDLQLSEVEVRLDGIAPNCHVDGDNPRPVTITTGSLVAVTFTVACLSTGQGLLLFSSDRSGTSHIYSIREDGTHLRDLTPSFEAGGGDWSADGSR